MTPTTRLFWFALLCWAGAILWLSSLTPQELPDAAFIAWDKVNHFLAYAVGGWLAAGTLRLSRPLAPSPAGWSSPSYWSPPSASPTRRYKH
jgi:hypothetical protein